MNQHLILPMMFLDRILPDDGRSFYLIELNLILCEFLCFSSLSGISMAERPQEHESLE